MSCSKTSAFGTATLKFGGKSGLDRFFQEPTSGF
jgi:hypothetical protein